MKKVKPKTNNMNPDHQIIPFPGLRPFRIEESHLFFGREGQSEDVLAKLAKNKFVAVIGASGSGKSSLMYCGLVPILYGGFITEAGSRWRIVTTRPGNSPVKNLAHALQEINPGQKDDQELQESVSQAVLMRSSKGLAECIKQLKLPPNENVLLLVDQFEELFRYKASREDVSTINESESFVSLLVEAVRQTDVPVFIVLTMRSDFIGDCSQFQELTDLINNSNYLVPQMTRDDFREAIMGPVAVGGAKIEPMLVQQLLNEVGDNPDQLPILQHAMMRTWEYWKELNDPNKPIGLSDYEAIGKMEKALSEHANEAFDELTQEGKRTCESLFKTLTEKGSDNRGIRHPTRVEVIAAIAHASVEDVMEVVEKFRATGRSFLTPSAEIPLNKDSVIDLSHESLMRIWNNLIIWVGEEASAVQMYNRLAEASEMFQEGKTGLWRPPDLQLALSWRKKQKPTLEWAGRYNPAFERAMVYLETSEKEFIAEEENKIRMQKRALRRTRVTALVLGAAAILSLGFMLWAFIQQAEAEKQRILADEATVDAKSQRAIAEEKTVEAETSAEAARLSAEVANSERAIADSAKIVAQENEQKAIVQEGIARDETARAEREKEKAEKSAEEAIQAQKLEEIAKQDASRRRMLSIAQSMAVKSLQIDQDTNLKSLLAFQAYLFNNKNSGVPNNADIYNGLYNALKFNQQDSYITFKGHTSTVNSVVFLPGTNIFYSAGTDGKVMKWDIGSFENDSVVVLKNATINNVLAISSDSKWLACGTSTLGIQLIDLSADNKVKTLDGHIGKIKSLAFLPDNKTLISSGVDKNVFVWDVVSGEKNLIWNDETVVQSLSVSPDGDFVAGGTKNGKIVLWASNNWDQRDVLEREINTPVEVVCFNNAGTNLISGDIDGNINILDTKNYKIVENLRGHSSRITDIKVSPDDKQIATASRDGTLQIWDAKDLNNQPVVIQDNEGFIFTVAFSTDGKNLLTGSNEEDRLVARPTRTEYMVENICSKISRNFTKSEWNVYVGNDVDYESTCKNIALDISSKNE
ncbi:MAG: hypothetical protein J7K53_13455 [Bacteroidales bacterium]|nr:hypothetical protein [Bacteroidales bacterium]